MTRLQTAATQRLEEIVRTAAIDLRRLREDIGLTQRAVARAAAVDQSLVSKIERGHVRPTVETYVRLATVLGADASLRFWMIRPSCSVMLQKVQPPKHPRWIEIENLIIL